jgi:asparagine synthase (glutamine-hydrolysing)
VNTYFVAKSARESGLKVALSGLGGDELFGSYNSFRDVPLIVKAFSLTGKIPQLGQQVRKITEPLLRNFVSPKYAGLMEYGGDFAGAYMLRRGLFMPWELESILTPHFVSEGLQKLQVLTRLKSNYNTQHPNRLKVMSLELNWFMLNQLLRDSDWAGMAHGLEIRTPYIDVPFFRKILPLLLKQDAPTKIDLSQSLLVPLPENILKRSKTGFSIPIREWLMQEQMVNRKDRRLRGWAKKVYNHQMAAL